MKSTGKGNCHLTKQGVPNLDALVAGRCKTCGKQVTK